MSLHVDDIILQYDGKPVSVPKDFTDMRATESIDGPEKELRVERGDKVLTFKVKPGILGVRLQTMYSRTYETRHILGAATQKTDDTQKLQEEIESDLPDGYVRNIMGPNGSIETVQFSPDGKLILAGGSDNNVWLWDVEGTYRKPKNKINPRFQVDSRHYREISSLCFAKDGKSFYSGALDGKIFRWNISSGKILDRYVYATHEDAEDYGVYDIALSPNEKLLAACGGAGILVIWNLKTRMETANQPFEQDSGKFMITSVTFSPDNRFVMATGGNIVHVYSLGENGHAQDKKVIDPGHEEFTYSGCFSHDGKWIMTTSDDGTVRIWDIAAKKVHRVFKHPKEVHIACFSADDRYVLSGCFDGIARLWDIESEALYQLGYLNANNIGVTGKIREGLEMMERAKEPNIFR